MPAGHPPPVFVVVPGAGLTPAHYGLLQHLLMQAGYGTISALLLSSSTTANVTIEDDAEFVRNRMILPILDIEEHDVIAVSHSYSSLPASAAACGLSKEERAEEGRGTSVIGQIFIAAFITRGGDGKDVVATFGGQIPPHLAFDEQTNLLRCDYPKPPLFHDVEAKLAEGSVASCTKASLTCFRSPVPRASWDAPGYRNRCAFIRKTSDRAIPLHVQDAMLAATEPEWITRDIDTGHVPQMVQPERLCRIILELAGQFESVEQDLKVRA